MIKVKQKWAQNLYSAMALVDINGVSFKLYSNDMIIIEEDIDQRYVLAVFTNRFDEDVYFKIPKERIQREFCLIKDGFKKLVETKPQLNRLMRVLE